MDGYKGWVGSLDGYKGWVMCLHVWPHKPLGLVATEVILSVPHIGFRCPCQALIHVRYRLGVVVRDDINIWPKMDRLQPGSPKELDFPITKASNCK